MIYREIRVRPVVRYVVTDFTCDEDYRNQQSVALGEFNNVAAANRVAEAIGVALCLQGVTPVIEPARALKIDWLRGPGEPREAIRWELSEVVTPPPSEVELRDAIAADIDPERG